jgi:hypothetical protein
VILFAISSVFGVYLFRKYRRDRKIAAEIAPEIEPDAN